jgi:hypothetical protein
MTHATAEEIHDHAYGFRLSDHVADCPQCGRAGAQLLAEREVLRDVLEEDSPEIPAYLLRRPRPVPRRITPPALAAAALLLAALTAMLLHREADRTPAAPAFVSQEAEIDRLLSELRSSSPLRKKIAGQALTRYGGSAFEAFEYFHTHPDLPAVRGETAEDRALLARLKKERITLKIERCLYTEVATLLQPHVGKVRVEIKADDLETAILTLNLDNVTVYEAVENISAQLKAPFSFRYGSLLIGKTSEELDFVPLRIAARPAEVARRIAQLSSDAPEQRDDAAHALRRMGFGAESALWQALDSASPETQSRAATLLQELYLAVAPPDILPAGWEKQPKVTIDVAGVPLQDAIAEILRQAGDLPLVWNSRIAILEENVSFKVQQIVPEGALKLLLQPREINCISGPGCALITSLEAHALPAPSPRALWARPVVARELETLIADLASGDPQRHEKAIRRLKEADAAQEPDLWTILDALAAASWTLEGDALNRVQRLRRNIAASHRAWISDLPSGADFQTLTAAQRALLDARVAIPTSEALTLAQLLKRDGVRADFRTPFAAAYRGLGKEPTRGALLRVALRPEGLDFYLDGETIVIDSAEKVQAAVEK